MLPETVGDGLVLCPPMIIGEKQLDEMFDIFEKSLDHFGKELG